MTVADLIAALGDFPLDLKVELTRTLAIDRQKGDAFEVRLDFPIVGLASKDEDLLLVTEADPHLLKFGKVTRLS